MAYTLEERAQAKARALSCGSADKAAKALEEIWDEAPSSRSIQNWMQDPGVQPDLRFLRVFSDEVNARVVHYADRILGPLAERIERSVAEGRKALDLHNDVRSFTFLANLVRPANASGHGGTNVYNLVDARPRPKVIIPFSLREDAKRETSEEAGGQTVTAEPPSARPTAVQYGGRSPIADRLWLGARRGASASQVHQRAADLLPEQHLPLVLPLRADLAQSDENASAGTFSSSRGRCKTPLGRSLG